MEGKHTRAYFSHVQEILDKVLRTQGAQIMAAAALMAETVRGGGNLFAFGCNHAALCTLELYYRTGGLVLINPLRGPGVSLDVDPVTLTTKMERLPGYGGVLLDESPAKSGDVLILHSVSGRNTVPIDMALRAAEKGIRTICLTNLATSSAIPSRHLCGKSLYQLCGVVIDNCGDYGDAAMTIDGFMGRIAPTSTAVGAAVLNAVVLETCVLLVEAGVEPPVFVSSNVPGGDEYNARMLKRYRENIFYMG